MAVVSRPNSVRVIGGVDEYPVDTIQSEGADQSSSFVSEFEIFFHHCQSGATLVELCQLARFGSRTSEFEKFAETCMLLTDWSTSAGPRESSVVLCRVGSDAGRLQAILRRFATQFRHFAFHKENYAENF